MADHFQLPRTTLNRVSADTCQLSSLRMRWAALLSLLLALVGSGCANSPDEAVPPGGARTYFDALDMRAPSAAAETFFDAFARDDFMTVWLVLHPVAQDRIRAALDLLQYGEVIKADAIPGDEIARIVQSSQRESIDIWYLFDAFMLVADEYDAFAIDLSGPVSFTGERVDGDEAELLVEAAGIEGQVVLRLTKTPKGHWRVLNAAIGGGDGPAVVWPVS